MFYHLNIAIRKYLHNQWC